MLDVDGTSPGQGVELPRRRRRGPLKTPTSSSSFTSTGDLGSELAHITDADTLFRWALEILPARNKLDQPQRAALDAAFFARADAIGADPELLTRLRASGTVPLGDGPALPSI